MAQVESYKVETRRFCCCLPARLGVFLLSLFFLLVGGFMGVIGWIQVSELKQHPMETSDEVALFLHSCIFSLLGFLAVFGFAGSLVKHRVLVVAFSIGLAVHVGLSIISGIFTMYALFQSNPKDAVDRCLNGATDEDTKQLCETGLAIVKGLVVAVYVFAWLLEIYGYFVSERYAAQLEDEELASLAPIIPQHFNNQVRERNRDSRYKEYAPWDRATERPLGDYDRDSQYKAYPPWDRATERPLSEYSLEYGPRRYTFGSYYYDSRRSWTERWSQPRDGDGRPQSYYSYTLPEQPYETKHTKDRPNMV